MTQWAIPDHFRDELPPSAEQLERLRRRWLDTLRSHGYQLVAPPLLEFVEALTVGSGRDLAERTFTVVDPITGRTLGVRPDMTPQVARIDAHLLNRSGVTRLCYAGPVAHARPAHLLAVREPWQLGAELYGHAGVDADIEIVGLLLNLLADAGLPRVRVELSHMGIFRALTHAMAAKEAERLFALLAAKNRADLARFLADVPQEAAITQAFLWLPHAYGGSEVLSAARTQLPPWPAVTSALDELATVVAALDGQGAEVGIDLADLRGYHYHTGLMFAVFVPGGASAVALGGRYDAMGATFGRARPATGFSIDLREVVSFLPVAPLPGAILAPALSSVDEAARAPLGQTVAALRAAGEVVVAALPGHSLASWQEAGCDRQLVWRNGCWMVEPLNT